MHNHLYKKNCDYTVLWFKYELQLDLGYPAISYPDISLLSRRELAVYGTVYFQLKSCSKQKQSSYISVLFHCLSILYLICYKKVLSNDVCFGNPTELAVFKHISHIRAIRPINPDTCRSQCGQKIKPRSDCTTIHL